MTIYDIIKEIGVTEGWSPVYGECEIELDRGLNEIVIGIGNGYNKMVLNNDGTFVEQGVCLIFPSKENGDWVVELERKKNQLLPKNTPVMVSDDGESWSVKYYINGQFCSINKTSIYGSCYRYIVPVSKFDFEADDLSINIKNYI